jgi:hypothetical protein
MNSDDRSKLGTDISTLMSRGKSGTTRGGRKQKSKSTLLGGSSTNTSRAVRAAGLKLNHVTS